MNKEHFQRLVKMMYKIDDCPALDEYGSRIFGRPVRKTWRLLRHLVRKATPDTADTWGWSSENELASYPKDSVVPTFEDFATIMLHEVTHGWCYFHKDNRSVFDYLDGLNEETVCWEVSRMVCERLGIAYQKKWVDLGYEFYLLSKKQDHDGIESLLKTFPPHFQR